MEGNPESRKYLPVESWILLFRNRNLLRWNLESSAWNPKYTAWNQEYKTVMDYLKWGQWNIRPYPTTVVTVNLL